MRLEQTTLPRDCLLLFGQEGPGISDDARAGAALTVSIAQFGSTRSINVAVAAGIAMHTWISQHGHIALACYPNALVDIELKRRLVIGPISARQGFRP